MYQYFWIIAIKASYETFLDLFFYQICNYTEVYIFVATYWQFFKSCEYIALRKLIWKVKSQLYL